MSNLAVIGKNKDLAEYTQDQLQLIINTVTRGATPDELQLFLYRCSLMKLNPLKPGQIFFIKYGQTATIVVGIEGFRNIANRSGRHVSTNRGVIRENGEITYGWCRVKRLDSNGNEQEFYEETPMAEYFNPSNPSWKKMKETMIKKCSEAACLRMAYPDDLGGVFIEEEKDVIEKVAVEVPKRPVVSIDQPNADEGDPNAFHEYTPGFGQWSRYTIEEIIKNNPVEKISQYMDRLDEYIAVGKYPENHLKMKEFNSRMSARLAELERKLTEDVPF
jgi:phage recombination protein Bet